MRSYHVLVLARVDVVAAIDYFVKDNAELAWQGLWAIQQLAAVHATQLVAYGAYEGAPLQKEILYYLLAAACYLLSAACHICMMRSPILLLAFLSSCRVVVELFAVCSSLLTNWAVTAGR